VIFIYVEVGDLIMVQLDRSDARAHRVPGIILRKFPTETPPTFEVLVKGESWVVTHKDVGPLDD